MNTDLRLSLGAWIGIALLGLGCASSQASRPASPEPDPVLTSRSGQRADLSMETPDAALSPVYFDTDRAELRPDARDTLKRHAQVIQQHPEWGTVTIEGHCDERGSEEYNLALGSRRAAAVSRYLADLGVPGARLATRTFGEDHPAVAGHDESSWSRNRRSELRSEGYEAARR
jgi:peptidoglycan-associated lipoprotein